MKRRRSERYENPLYGWLSISVFSVMAAGVAATLWVGSHSEQWRQEDLRKWKSWPSVVGTAGETQIEERLSGRYTRSLVIRTYVLRCRVRYSVSDKEYSIWVEGESSFDRSRLTDNKQACPVSSYEVHYDPNHPWIAHAFTADGSA